MFLRFAYAQLLYILLPLYALLLLYRWKFHKTPRYVYPLTGEVARLGFASAATGYRFVLFGLRAASLLVLLFLACRPQWVDERSVINVNGVDIVLTIDVSESMQLYDDQRDNRNRLEVAKEEAIRFIEKRPNDPMGVVIFGTDALSLCPLTLDKNVLKEVVGEVRLGFINGNGTAIGTGLAAALNRLKNSKAKSKVVVFLTDGEPTVSIDRVSPEQAIELAKQLGVKVYTVGIGNENGALYNHPVFGWQRVPGGFGVALLEKIARETGGVFFRASSPQDMRLIYDKIDRLERTEYQTNLFSHYYEAFLAIIWVVFALLALELVFRLFIWRGI